MLTLHGIGKSASNLAADGAVPDECAWFDLIDPTAEEVQRVEQATGLRLPSRERIRSVEMSSRVAVDGDALHLNVPFFTHDETLPATPLGLIVLPKHLISIRYADSPAFALAAQAIRIAPIPGDGAAAFATLIEAIVGQIADRMESVTVEAGVLSTRVLGEQSHSTKMLRTTLGEVGRLESRLMRARLTSTSLLRVVLFAHESAPAWVAKTEVARLKVAYKDLVVLGELDVQLTDKLQFLLDAVLGFINIDQNDVMKILTVASVASIPPVILVGIWGMNFARMPELHWPYGYPMALAAIVLSVVVPVLWFKRRGWL